MAIPVIDQPASPRIIATGVPFSLQLTASESPDAWAVTGLPSGLGYDPETGLISGTPLVAGTASVSATAENGEGTSSPVTLVIVVMSRPPGADDSAFSLLLDMEVGDGRNLVSIPGVEPPAEGGPLFLAPAGTNINILLGIKRYGVLQDVNPAGEQVEALMGMKADDTERLLEVTNGPTTKIADQPDDLQRYKFPLRITPANWMSDLSDVEEPGGTRILALSEIQVQVGASAELYDEIDADEAIPLEGGMSAGATGDVEFVGIDEFAAPTRMRLTLTLAVAGRPLQTVELVRTFDLIFSGGVFAISNLSGATTGQGAVEGDKWRATLSLEDLTGGATKVAASYKIATTDDESVEHYVWELDLSGSLSGDLLGSEEVSLASPTYLTLWDANEEQMGLTSGIEGGYSDLAQLLSTIEGAWNSNGGGTHIAYIQAVSSSVVRLEVPDTTSVRFAAIDDTDPPATLIGPIMTPGVEGEPKTASVTARLEQLESAESIPLNLTSRQFLVEVARSLTPD